MRDSARVFALFTMFCWYSRKEGCSASLNETALAAITCTSGPPCPPGNSTLSIVFAWSCAATAADTAGGHVAFYAPSLSGSDSGLQEVEGDLTLYDASMGEWAKDVTLPIETD